MPNWVLNEVIFRRVDKDKQDQIVKKACDAEGRVDFTILLPPINNWDGSRDERHRGTWPHWREWAEYTWGTCANACDDRPIERSADTLTLVFETRWRAPYGWIVAVFNHFKVSIEHNWLIEFGVRARSGAFNYPRAAGERPEWVEVDANDEVHRRLHTMFWGCESFPVPGCPESRFSQPDEVRQQSDCTQDGRDNLVEQ